MARSREEVMRERKEEQERNEKINETKRVRYAAGLYRRSGNICQRGHQLKRGPWGLEICEECTYITLAELKRKQ